MVGRVHSIGFHTGFYPRSADYDWLNWHHLDGFSVRRQVAAHKVGCQAGMSGYDERKAANLKPVQILVRDG